MTVYEMEGFLRGKCLPGDMKVNESNAQYLVRKFSEFESNLSESQREFRAADATIHNLELQLTDMAVQLANAESKCRELQSDNDSLEAVAVSMRDDMRDARENLEELDNALCELLPGTQYMDPPDGGSVTPLEQVRRMVADYRNRIAELEARTVSVHWPVPKDSTQGWKVDPEFISKVQDAIGYDEECKCWEGTPSMEMVESVLIAAAGIKLDVRS